MRRRRARICAEEAGGSGWPSKRISPAVGSTRRKSMRATVLLPEPDSPTRPSVSPGMMANDTSSTTRDVPPSHGYSFDRPRASTRAGAFGGTEPVPCSEPVSRVDIAGMVASRWVSDGGPHFHLQEPCRHAGCHQPCGKDRPYYRSQCGDRVGDGAWVRCEGRARRGDGEA